MAKNNIRYFVFVFAFVVLMIVSLFPFNTYANDTDAWDGESVAIGFETGAGKKSNPYVIASAEQFVYFARSVNDGTLNSGDYYILTSDIDLGGNEWVPIGLINQLTFSGTLDGCGHVISNFKITSSLESTRVGLFGIVNNPTTVIKNLTIANASIEVTGLKSYAGALVGYLQGGATVSGCRIASDVTVTGVIGSTGGVAGRAVTSAIIEYTVNEATVSATGSSNLFVGGIAGVVGSDGYVNYCVNKGDVSGIRDGDGESEAIYVGGITGCFGASSTGGIVENSYNSGTINSTVSAGGIIGFTNTEGNKINNCFNLSPTITGNSKYAGSIIGYIKNPLEITNCMSVTVSGLGTNGSAVSNSQTSLSGLMVKTSEEVTAQTNAINEAIQANAEKEAEIVYNPTDEETTAADTTTAPVTSPTTTSSKTSSTASTTDASSTGQNSDDSDDGGNNSLIIIISVIVVIAVAAGIIVFISQKKRK